jgi:DNA-directed RNA polymerase specialized sigma24 family protein
VEVSEGPTGEDFARLLELLGGPERFAAFRRRLVRLFEWRGTEVPEDLADETIQRVARALGRGLVIEARDPYSYFCGVAHLVHKEYLRDRARASSSEEWIRRHGPEAQEEVEDSRLDCLRSCLDRLPEDQRRLVLDYHGGEDRIRVRQGLAKNLGDSLNALRIRVHRIRRQVEACLAACLGEGR